MGRYNRHGLLRDIPAGVKRTVRQRCGFGCVVCGLGIVQYEHVEPEYYDAKEHDPNNMALLCPQCHAKVSTGFMSKEKVKKAMQNPAGLRVGFSKEVFDFCGGHPSLQFGGVLLSDCPIPVAVKGQPLFKIEAPEEYGAPFRLSGLFTDNSGRVTLKIIENEWFASTANRDVEVSGGAILIREKARKVHLKLVVAPPDKLIVDRLDMNLFGIGFEANGDFLRVKFPNGNSNTFTGCICDGGRVGMAF